jgi:hypothetical protein
MMPASINPTTAMIPAREIRSRVRASVLTPGFLSPKFRDRVLQHAEPL